MWDLPQDLLDFLAAGEPLAYDASRCECGQVTLKRPEDLSVGYARALEGDKSGHYVVPVIGLTATAQRYDPRCILAWLPGERKLATVDPDHGRVSIWRGARWSDVVARPLRYVNAQWSAGKGLKRYSAEYTCGFVALEAAPELPAAIRQGDDPLHLLAWAEFAAESWRFDLAEPLFQGVLDRGVTQLGLLTRLGECALLDGRTVLARERFEVAADEGDVVALAYLADVGQPDALTRLAAPESALRAGWMFDHRHLMVTRSTLAGMLETLDAQGFPPTVVDMSDYHGAPRRDATHLVLKSA